MNLTAFTTIAQNSLKTISLLTYAQILIVNFRILLIIPIRLE